MKHVNTSSLTLVMFVALAFLSTTHGKNPETRESARPKATKTEVVINNFTPDIRSAGRDNGDVIYEVGKE
jgi:hypothetical protein